MKKLIAGFIAIAMVPGADAEGAPASSRVGSVRAATVVRAGTVTPIGSKTASKAALNSARLSSSAFLGNRGKLITGGSLKPGNSGTPGGGGGNQDADLSGYATTEQLDELETMLRDLETDVGSKPDAEDTYTKEEIDQKLIDGIQGEDGPSAYEVAVQEGFVGTEAQWLESLKGPKGDPGNGASCAGSGDGEYVLRVTGGVETCIVLQKSADTFTE